MNTIALDLGSTSIKAGVFNAKAEFDNLYTHPSPAVVGDNGRYEADALDYLDSATQLLKRCVADANNSAQLGLSCQRSSFLIWNKATGLPITPLISWQDNRGSQFATRLKSHENQIIQQTGLRLTAYYFAPKLALLLEQHPQWRDDLEQGILLVGTLDCFLIWHWSGKNHYQIDASMAARTLLMDVNTGNWSAALCQLFSIPLHSLPQIKPSYGLQLPLFSGCSLNASIADQSAAVLASIPVDKSSALVNLGTGGFVICYGEEKNNGYLRSLVYQDQHLNNYFATEGTLNSIAAALQPYPFQHCQIKQLAQFPTLFCSPEPSGIGAPYFQPQSGLVFSAAVVNLNPEQIACLLLEGIIFRVARILEDFRQLSGIRRVYLAGGLSTLDLLQQGLAVCSGVEIFYLQQKESSLQGAALLATETTDFGIPLASKVAVKSDIEALKHKYQRWKSWFDKRLSESATTLE